MSSETPRPATFYDDQGDRHYRDPRNHTITWTGVSAILGTRHQPWLERAKRRGIAEYAARHRKELAEFSRAPDVVAKLMDESVVLPEWTAKRDAGTSAHQAVDDIITARDVGTAGLPDDDPRVWARRWWTEFRAATGFKPIDSEQTVISDRFGYGGSYDLYGELPDGRRCLVDVKTNQNGPKPDVGLQLEFYHRADRILNPTTGERRPMHVVDAHFTLWLRPDGWAWVPILSGDRVWRECYARLLTYRFDIADEIIGQAEAGNLDIPRGWF